MLIAMSILSLFFFSVILHHAVAWAGSFLHEVGNTENQYALFTFQDDRNTPMTTNALMNIFIPNVVMVFIFMISYKLNLEYICKYIVVFVFSFYFYRMLLICFFLRRKEMYSFAYEITIAIIGCGISLFINYFFFSSETTLFISAAELRSEFWLIIMLIIYKFMKQILDKHMLQNMILKRVQILRYIIGKFNIFSKRYNHLLDINANNRYVCILLYSIMIFEDFNRGPIIRAFERMKIRIGKSATVGIMQMKSDKTLSDEESVILAYNWLENRIIDYTQFKLDEEFVNSIAAEYNNDSRYAKSVTFIYTCLYEHIHKVPRYRNMFHIQNMYNDKPNSDTHEVLPYEQIMCNHKDGFIDSIDSNRFLSFSGDPYDISEIITSNPSIKLAKIYDGTEVVVENINQLYLCGNGTSIISTSQYATVLTFVNCKNITIDNLKLGHSEGVSSCEGAVLKFCNCSNISIRNLQLYGCGTHGVIVNDSNISIHECRIYNCSYGALSIRDSSCNITNSEIYNCLNTLESFIYAKDSSVTICDTIIHDCSTNNYALESNNNYVVCNGLIIDRCHCTVGFTNLINESGITVLTSTI